MFPSRFEPRNGSVATRFVGKGYDTSVIVLGVEMASASLAWEDAKRALHGVFPEAKEEEVAEALRRSSGKLEDAVDAMLARRGSNADVFVHEQGTSTREEACVPTDPLVEGVERRQQVESDEAYALLLQQQLYHDGARASTSEAYVVLDGAEVDRWDADEPSHDPLQLVRDGLSHVGQAIGSGLQYLYQSFAGEDVADEADDGDGSDGGMEEDWEDEDEQEAVEDQVIRSTTLDQPRALRKRHVDAHVEGEETTWNATIKKKGD